MILDGPNTSEIRCYRDRQHDPPNDSLIPYILAKPAEKEQKRELNTPKTRIEKYDNDNRSSQVLLCAMREVGRDDMKLSRCELNVFIHSINTNFPYDAVDEKHNTGKHD